MNGRNETKRKKNTRNLVHISHIHTMNCHFRGRRRKKKTVENARTHKLTFCLGSRVRITIYEQINEKHTKHTKLHRFIKGIKFIQTNNKNANTKRITISAYFEKWNFLFVFFPFEILKTIEQSLCVQNSFHFNDLNVTQHYISIYILHWTCQKC